MSPVRESNEDRGFTFRFETPAIQPIKGPDGSFELRLDRFETRERRSGAPDIPLRMIRVAIPEGVVPRLEIASVREEHRPGLRPRPVATDVSEFRGDSEGVERRSFRERDETLYEAASETLDRIAWLGEIGTLRDQRYVEVYLAPVRFDPRIDGLRVATAFDVSLRFDGDSGRRFAPRPDPRFESVYRNSFVNYGQGTTFRISSSAAEATANRAATQAAVETTGPIQRIKVRQNGVVRLDFTRMNSLTGFLSANLSTWKLTNRGVEVPLEINDGNNNGFMDSGDWVQFYGQALDDEPKAVLNTDIPGTPADIFEARDFTDENTYFLTVLAGPRSRVATVPGAPTMSRVPPTSFQAVAHAEVDSPTGFRPLGAADPWYWTPTQSNPENLQAGFLASRTVPVNLPGLASGTLPARVKVHIRGISESEPTYPDHKSHIILKDNTVPGNELAANDDNGSFDGRNLYLHDFDWTYPGSGPTLTNPAQVTIQAMPVAAGAVKNEMILDWVEVQYRALFQASGDVLTFDYPDGDSEFIVSGLTGSSPQIWEITGRVPSSNIVRPVRLSSPTTTGVGPFTTRFRVDNEAALVDGSPRRFVVFGSGGVTIPANPDFAADTVSDLRLNTNQADLIVIAHPTVLDVQSLPILNQLLDYHQSKGIRSKIVKIGDIEDEFNEGLPGPIAIKNFLRWVTSTANGEGWADPKPAYVLIIGDGTLDYKGGPAQGNYVPTQLMFRDDPALGSYASDNVMAAVIGDDQLADLVVGRIPARTDAVAKSILQKMVAYTGAPGGNWRRNAILIADRGKRDASGSIDLGEVWNFQGIGDTSESLMTIPPYTTQKFYFYESYCTHVVPEDCNAGAMTADINGAISSVSLGAAIVQVAAHGNYEVWSDEPWWDDRAGNLNPDTLDLTNGGRLPWVIAHGCLTGSFHPTAATTIGENWLKHGAGGAIALFAPSDLTFTFLGFTVAESIFDDLYGPPKERTTAVTVMNALSSLCGNGSTEACQGYTFLGDPVTDLALPTVGPPQNVVATGGNARVDLSWGASTTAGAKYVVYRTTDLVHIPMAKITASPITVLNYADTGRTNGVTYYYSVLAVDTSGFESRWSHFNTDCAQSGPDCLKATAMNPIPPAQPTGLVVTDPETSQKLILTWTANPVSDEVSYYSVHYGTSSGDYTTVKNVGKTTSTTLLGLADGTTYFIAIKATSTSGLTSPYSLQQTGKPTFVPGVRSPDFISDIKLAKSGTTDIVVSFSPVTSTIYGKAATISRYEVYRGTTLSFVPGPSNLVSPPNFTATSFTDFGALSSGVNYYYLVRAVDAQGNVGGLGNQLPMGISTLTATKSTITPGNIVVTWPAVTTAFTTGPAPGTPLAIHHYEIYGRSTPFTRAEIPGTVPLITTTTSTSIELTPPSTTLYYSVLAVDARGNKSPF